MAGFFIVVLDCLAVALVLVPTALYVRRRLLSNSCATPRCEGQQSKLCVDKHCPTCCVALHKGACHTAHVQKGTA